MRAWYEIIEEIHELPEPAGQRGWRSADAAARDPRLMEYLLDRTCAAAGTTHRPLAASWHLEKHAWWTAALLFGAAATQGAMPSLDELQVRDGDSGWIEALAVGTDGWVPGVLPVVLN